MEKSFIIGKDAALEDSISRMQAQLLALGFHIEEHSWLNPIPNVWSVHIRDTDCPLLFTNGKGASRKAALASALGEFFERLATNYFWADYYLGDNIAHAGFVHYAAEKWFPLNSDNSNDNSNDNDTLWPTGLLSTELIEFYNPHNTIATSQLIDINSGNASRGICALPYTRHRDQETIWFPVNIIGNLYVSNGMSAGNNPHEAYVQALSEIFERHVKFEIISNEICLPDIPEEVIKQYPSIYTGIQKLEQEGFGILVKDASLGGRYPVINVTLLNPENNGCFASFGAHPKFEVALERTLTELLQGRALDALNDFQAPSHDHEEIPSVENLETHFIDSAGLISWAFFKETPDYEFNHWNIEGNTQQEFDWLCDLIHEMGRDIYISDYNHLGVAACRILVPSMSEIYPCDDLEWNNNSAGISFREDILNIKSLDQQQKTTLLENIQSADIDDMQLLSSLIGLPTSAGTLWKDYRVAELKLILALATEQRDMALSICDWLISFDQIDKQRLQQYHCLYAQLPFAEDTDRQEYLGNIKKIFPEAIMLKTEQLMKGEFPYDLQNDLQLKLIDAYRKLIVTKDSDKAN